MKKSLRYALAPKALYNEISGLRDLKYRGSGTLKFGCVDLRWKLAPDVELRRTLWRLLSEEGKSTLTIIVQVPDCPLILCSLNLSMVFVKFWACNSCRMNEGLLSSRWWRPCN